MDRELAAYHVEVEEFLPAGDDLLVLVKWRASGLTGVPVEQPMAFAFTICDGLTPAS